MQIKPFRALYAKPQLIDSPGEFCGASKHAFKKHLEAGVYERMESEALYIYQIEMDRYRYIGLAGLNHVDDLLKGHIKPHEKTLEEREEKQRKLFLSWKAILKPVLVAHTPVPELQVWLNSYTAAHQPLSVIRFKKEQTVHRFWTITEPENIEYLHHLFATQIKETYIADGHHRSFTTAKLYQNPDMNPTGLDFTYIFSAWFASDQLDILDFNRVVKGIKKIKPVNFMAQLSRIFDIECLEQPRKPVRKHEIVMFIQNSWFALSWKDWVLRESAKGADTLDAALFNEWVAGKILGIEDVRTDTRIVYVEGSVGLEGLEKATGRKSGDRAGFALYPVAFEDMTQLADAGECLPPKSTYFEPRLKSGLLVRLLED